MKTKKLSIKELAAIIGVSTDTIRRAVRKGQIPATRVRTALRFDLHQVLRCMRRNAEAKLGDAQPARRAARPAARRPIRPRLVTRGHYPHRCLHPVYGFSALHVPPDHA
jgi:excisionase family DNA binding protein